VQTQDNSQQLKLKLQLQLQCERVAAREVWRHDPHALLLRDWLLSCGLQVP
jgi:hypothetical protein